MRLLQLRDDGEFSLVEYFRNNIPRYAILSHTWGRDQEEFTFENIEKGTGKNKAGYRKVHFCGMQAAKDGLEHFWVDTCCIDKKSSAELTEAINSMFRWYQNAARCYVYLSDVSVSGSVKDDEFSRRWKPAFKRSRWFTRGWTLQELIAPTSVEFFSKEEQRLGDKQSLDQTLHEITGIAIQAFRGTPLSHFSVNERMSWAKNRRTKREEDEVYSLLGIFNINMPSTYGEGREEALTRLQKNLKEKEKEERTMLDSLRFNQIDARQMTVKNAHAKTCKWLLKKSEYLEWLDDTKLSEHHGFLWIKGNPGTGKSTLMKFALTNARETMKDKIVLSFFFNARGEDLEKSTIGTYQTLLLRLLEQIPVLQSVFELLGLPKSSISTNYKWTVESLKMLLGKATQRLKSSVVCFIDALDECEERQIRDMVSFFEQVGELAVSTDVKFRICLSSRHYPYITIRKNLNLVLDRQEGHDQDIADYLASELRIGHSKLAEQIRVEVQRKASGIFLWVILVVGILNKEHDSGRIHALRRRLREIPSDLHELFYNILTRDSINSDELVLCVQWVLFATQPLKPEQLYFAVLSGVEPDALSRWDPDEVTIKDIERYILNASKGLSELTKSNTPTVQFIHESVKDFLLEENALASIWPDLGSNFQGQSHERLKNCCLNYMGFTHMNLPMGLPKASSQRAADFRPPATDALPFLEYAVLNVLHHANVAGGGIAQENFIQSFPFADWLWLYNLFEKDELRRYSQNVSLLYVLAESNMSNLIRAHPSIFSCLEVENEHYGPPFFAALATRSEEAIQTFVASVSPKSQFHNLCSRYHHNEGNRGKFRHDFKFSNRRTTLSYLAELGDEAIFAFGLETGNIMPDSKDRDGRTPLSWASAMGHQAIVTLLLDTGKVNLDSKDADGWTPLWWAAKNRRESVVKTLLDTDKVDLDSKDADGRTLLSWASWDRHEVLIKLLLDTGKVDATSKDTDGRTPLSWAAMNGCEAIVKLLLDTGKVDVDSKDKYGRTPLWWAAWNECEAIVKLLLDTGRSMLTRRISTDRRRYRGRQ
ncbi:hypothetical protein CC86DRAFT_207501 [Ophiobolus disseminans]|uniref:Uncharacterized protein n=1 Tax=Ophiobolus disseminans TaxID=1469910 RepID=A0A6A7A1F2_9PLEO|nr:hypothetical protein CC86DRAFT_207501 [Ophiobolus disseminans]